MRGNAVRCRSDPARRRRVLAARFAPQPVRGLDLEPTGSPIGRGRGVRSAEVQRRRAAGDGVRGRTKRPQAE